VRRQRLRQRRRLQVRLQAADGAVQRQRRQQVPHPLPRLHVIGHIRARRVGACADAVRAGPTPYVLDVESRELTLSEVEVDDSEVVLPDQRTSHAACSSSARATEYMDAVPSFRNVSTVSVAVMGAPAAAEGPQVIMTPGVSMPVRVATPTTALLNAMLYDLRLRADCTPPASGRADAGS
jgi:hypothetical protein